MAGTAGTAAEPYILGHARGELDRLISQSRYIGDLSEHLLRLAGLEAGMRVLDVGCGAGDLSFLAAHLVGPTGAVIGIDRSRESIALASARAAEASVRNVTFIEADAGEFELKEPADALIGRLVLMYWPDAAERVRHLTRSIRRGGIVTFQDYDIEKSQSEPFCPLFEGSLARLRETFARAGADMRMGLKLGRVFEDAGLPSPEMRLEARIERGPEAHMCHQAAEITRTMLPAMERFGVVSAAKVDIDTLEQRLRAEMLALRATVVSPLLVAAWARTT